MARKKFKTCMKPRPWIGDLVTPKTKAELERLVKHQLETLCYYHGLIVSGSSDDLVRRLEEWRANGCPEFGPAQNPPYFYIKRNSNGNIKIESDNDTGDGSGDGGDDGSDDESDNDGDDGEISSLSSLADESALMTAKIMSLFQGIIDSSMGSSSDEDLQTNNEGASAKDAASEFSIDRKAEMESKIEAAKSLLNSFFERINHTIEAIAALSFKSRSYTGVAGGSPSNEHTSSHHELVRATSGLSITQSTDAWKHGAFSIRSRIAIQPAGPPRSINNRAPLVTSVSQSLAKSVNHDSPAETQLAPAQIGHAESTLVESNNNNTRPGSRRTTDPVPADPNPRQTGPPFNQPSKRRPMAEISGTSSSENIAAGRSHEVRSMQTSLAPAQKRKEPTGLHPTEQESAAKGFKRAHSEAFEASINLIRTGSNKSKSSMTMDNQPIEHKLKEARELSYMFLPETFSNVSDGNMSALHNRLLTIASKVDTLMVDRLVKTLKLKAEGPLGRGDQLKHPEPRHAKGLRADKTGYFIIFGKGDLAKATMRTAMSMYGGVDWSGHKMRWESTTI